MAKSILIVGQGPSKSGVGKPPLDGNGSGDRLAKLCGVTKEKMFEMVDAVNLLDEWYGKNGKGDKFPIEIAREKAKVLAASDWKKYKRIVFLGQNVADAFGFCGEPLIRLAFEGHEDVSMLPHPSGVNRFYNDLNNKKAANTFLTSLFSDFAVSDEAISRSSRAQFITGKLEEFEKRFENWADLGALLVECERDKLYLEVGAKTWEEWVRHHAPRSYTHCYTSKLQYRNLIGHISIEKLRTYPPETAKWASKAKNLSPAVLGKPEVQEALMLSPKKAIAALKEILPDQHIEDTRNVLLKFEASQYRSIFEESYEAYKLFRDESSSKENFMEYLANEFMESQFEDGSTIRERWEKKGTEDDNQEKAKAESSIASL